MSLFDNTFVPIGLSIQRGNVGNFSGVHKFGLNTAVGSGAFETVWDGNNTYTYPSSSHKLLKNINRERKRNEFI